MEKNWEGTIPIYINNFNRLTTTKKLAQYFDDVPGTKVIIVDNGSTYQPLLDWYDACPYGIIKLNQNYGHQAPWRAGCCLWGYTHKMYYGSDYYVVTDADLDLSKCPKDVLSILVHGRKNNAVLKVGVSLEVNDIPDGYPGKSSVISWEKQYWVNKTSDPRFFRANVDTTFALYLITDMHAHVMATGPALRTDRPYTAMHTPWYVTKETITNEDRFVLQNTPDRYRNWIKVFKQLC
jgi:hypothetical protein